MQWELILEYTSLDSHKMFLQALDSLNQHRKDSHVIVVTKYFAKTFLLLQCSHTGFRNSCHKQNALEYTKMAAHFTDFPGLKKWWGPSLYWDCEGCMIPFIGTTHLVLSNLTPHWGLCKLRSLTKQTSLSLYRFLLPEMQNILSSCNSPASYTCLVTTSDSTNL